MRLDLCTGDLVVEMPTIGFPSAIYRVVGTDNEKGTFRGIAVFRLSSTNYSQRPQTFNTGFYRRTTKEEIVGWTLALAELCKSL